MILPFLLIYLAAGACAAAAVGDQEAKQVAAPPPITGTARALEFLKREVPSWPRENGCYSCHNNGDAARALFRAKALGVDIPFSALKDTVQWLQSPGKWTENKGDPGFSDQRLADIQFGFALSMAKQAGLITGQTSLHIAARRVAAHQSAEGAWPVDEANPPGSPATYGSVLATVAALQLLKEARLPELEPRLHKGTRWLGQVAPVNTLAAAALLLGSRSLSLSPEQESAALLFLRQAQTTEGGWGPYKDAPAEVFDTALALLALKASAPSALDRRTIQRGVAYLLKTQNPDGSWPATTRPSGGASYAQTLSTTGWATLALLESLPAEK